MRKSHILAQSRPLAIALTVVGCGLLGFAPLRAEDWPQWRGPRANSTWHGPALPDAWPEGGLPVAWRRAVGGGYAGPVTDGRLLYLFDRHLQPAEVERLSALDPASGEVRWVHDTPVIYGKLDYGNGPRAAPTIHEGRVYTLGTVGHLNCLDAATGRVLWTKDLVAEQAAVIPTWGLAASLLIYGPLVIVHAGLPRGCLAAFDQVTGEERWRAGDDPAGYATPIIVPRTDGDLLICWSPTNVLGFEPDTGRLLWSSPYEVTYGVSIATPLVERDVLVVCGYWEGSRALTLGQKRADIAERWTENEFLRGLMAPPLVKDGYAYLLDKQYGLTCFEIATGRKLWDDGNRLTPRGRNPQASLVWLGDSDRVLALNSEGELILARLSPSGYEEQSRCKYIGPTWVHFALSGEMIFARDETELVAGRLVR